VSVLQMMAADADDGDNQREGAVQKSPTLGSAESSALASEASGNDDVGGGRSPLSPAGRLANNLRQSVHEADPAHSARFSLEYAGSLAVLTKTSSRISHNRLDDFRPPKDGKTQHVMPIKYNLNAGVIKKAFSRLDSTYSPDSPGELRSDVVVAALARFDRHFRNHRTPLERMHLVDELERPKTDFTKVKWNAPPLFEAFSVRLNMAERIFFTVDMGETSNTLSRFVSALMLTAVILSICIWMASTIPAFTVADPTDPEGDPVPLRWMQVIDETCVILFTWEFLTRLFTAPFVRTKLLRPRFLLTLLFVRPNMLRHSVRRSRTSECEEEDEDTAACIGPASGVVEWMTNLGHFLRSPSVIVDLLTILPFWIEQIFQTSTGRLVWLRLFRLLRISRVFKLIQLLNSDLGQLSDAKHLFVNVVAQASPAFAMTLTLLLFALLVFSAMMYIFERGSWYPRKLILDMGDDLFSVCQDYASQVLFVVQKDGGVFLRQLPNGVLAPSPFTSITSASWWTLATITTVGYGDVTPVTIAGKVVGSIAILYGTVLLGLPIGIIGSQFSNEFARMVSMNRMRNEALQNAQTGEEDGDSEAKGGDEEPTEPIEPKGFGSTMRATLKTVGSRVALPSTLTAPLSSRRKIRQSWKTKSEYASKRLQKLPLDPKERQQLMTAKYSFEDLLQVYGDELNIPADTQQTWLETLWANEFCAGPELDRLSGRVLTYLSDAELRRGSGNVQRVRLAWLNLSLACCGVADIIAEQEKMESRLAAADQELPELAELSDDESKHSKSEGPPPEADVQREVPQAEASTSVQKISL